jgi:hypothetical protein
MLGALRPRGGAGGEILVRARQDAERLSVAVALAPQLAHRLVRALGGTAPGQGQASELPQSEVSGPAPERIPDRLAGDEGLPDGEELLGALLHGAERRERGVPCDPARVGGSGPAHGVRYPARP